MKKIYNPEVDMLKGIGIILMVIGHAGGSFTPFIYLFHMPLFYYISGYTFNYNYINYKKKFLKNKIKSLYLPFIKYNLIFVLLHNIFVNIHIYSENMLYDRNTMIINFLKNIIFINTEQINGGFWFLITLFMGNIIYLLIIFMFKSIKDKNLYIGIIVIILFILNITVLSNKIIIENSILNYYFIMIRVAITSLVFIFLGSLVKQNKLDSKCEYNILVMVVITIYLYINTKYGSISMGSNEYGSSPTFFVFNAIIGIILCILVVKYVKKINFISRFLVLCGKNTLIILALHMLSFKLVNYIQIKVYKYPLEYMSAFPYISGTHGWWILYSIIGVYLPLIIVLLKNSFINKYTIRNNT
ncbi:acyltransferase family protein [Clostridium perfringens]|uniref:acyltransferase family protein n=1 Tax=Clostridium perfringens TaxID=1502 RepID=UPI0039E7F90B